MLCACACISIFNSSFKQVSFVSLSVCQPTSQFDSSPVCTDKYIYVKSVHLPVHWISVDRILQLSITSINMECRLSVYLRVALSATLWLHSTPSHTFVRCGCQLSGSRLLRCRRQRIQLKIAADDNVFSYQVIRSQWSARH